MLAGSPLRRCLFVAFSLASCLIAGAGELRTWTSADGRTVEAEFVLLDGDIVEIKNERGSYRLPLSKLSVEDQEFAQEQAEASKPRRPIRIEIREWQVGGEKVKARFVRVRDLDVQIIRGKQVMSISMLAISRDDLAYVYEVLKSRGDLEKKKDDPGIKLLVSKAEGEGIAEPERSNSRPREVVGTAASPIEPESPEEKQPTQSIVQSANESAPVDNGATKPSATTDEATTGKQRLSREEMLRLLAEKSGRNVEPQQSYVPPEQAESNQPSAAAPTLPPPMVMPMPNTGSTPPVTSELRKDAWEQDLEVMENSNRNAYYFLGGVLALLMLFGPIVWAFQRSR